MEVSFRSPGVWSYTAGYFFRREVKSLEHQALYRKYRPRTFDDVYGQDHITSVLKYESEMGKLSHAYLFCGPRGTGKTTCAKILAKAVNCDDPVHGDPCGKCFKCQSVDDGSATDVVEMDAASNTGVDYIRDIREEVTYSPAMMKKRVYIIDEVHMLSIGAFNALLKTLEEPPEHVMFILATTEQHKLPATIVSRCQRFDFRRITVEDLAARLKYIAEKEEIGLEADAAILLAKQAQGGMRDAINLFELCAGGGHAVTADRVRDVLGISGIENAYKTALAVKNNDTAALFEAVANVTSSSKDVNVFWGELISFWRDMLVAKNVKDAGAYLDLTSSDEELLRDAAEKFTGAELVYQSGLLDDALVSMNKIPQMKRNIAELTLVRMCSPSLDTTPEALLARIASLEDRLTLLGSGAPVQKAVPKEIKKKEEKTEDAPKPEKKPAPAPASRTGLMEVPDKSELLERINSLNPMLCGFLKDAGCFVSADGDRIVVRVQNAFTVTMLDSDDSKRSIADAFALAGLAGAGAEVTVEACAEKRENSMLDELDTDF